MKVIQIEIIERNGGTFTVVDGPPLSAFSETGDEIEAFQKLDTLFIQPAYIRFRDSGGRYCILHTDDIRGARLRVIEIEVESEGAEEKTDEVGAP